MKLFGNPYLDFYHYRETVVTNTGLKAANIRVRILIFLYQKVFIHFIRFDAAYAMVDIFYDQIT